MSAEVLDAPAGPAVPAAAAAPAAETPSSSPGGAQGIQRLPASAAIPPPVATKTPRSAEPDSALNRARARLEAKVQGKPVPAETPKPAAKPAEAATPEAKSAATEVDEDDALMDEKASGKSEMPEEGKEAKEGEVATEAKPGETKEKVNPWKVVEEHKTARAQLEKEVVELKRLIPNAEARKQELAEVESVKKRNEELEQHIKFVDYQMSNEYKETYEKPYEQQWVKSMQELKGTVVSGGDGLEDREITAQDMLELVNMPNGKAKALAKEVFGDAWDDVMKEREKIRELTDKKFEAVKKAKQDGAEWSDKTVKAHEAKVSQLNEEVSKTYKRAVDAFTNNPKYAEYFKPIEGDETANITLTDGYAMVDKAFAINAMDPRLTPEQRASAVKLHAAVRHRAAAFGRVKHLLVKSRASEAAMAKKLAQYESTVPGREGSRPITGGVTASSGSKMEAALARLKASAK